MHPPGRACMHAAAISVATPDTHNYYHLHDNRFVPAHISTAEQASYLAWVPMQHVWHARSITAWSCQRP